MALLLSRGGLVLHEGSILRFVKCMRENNVSKDFASIQQMGYNTKGRKGQMSKKNKALECRNIILSLHLSSHFSTPANPFLLHDRPIFSHSTWTFAVFTILVDCVWPLKQDSSHLNQWDIFHMGESKCVWQYIHLEDTAFWLQVKPQLVRSNKHRPNTRQRSDTKVMDPAIGV